jgi:hypothetical protein
MKTFRVYVDTSVLGGCFDREFESWSNALIGDFFAGRFVPVVSDLVVAECDAAPPAVRSKLDEVLAFGAELLAIDRETLELAEQYAGHEILPPRFRNDLLHIAVATVADVDVLVSWNFKHIVRLDKIRRYSAVNLEAGYRPLQIRSPREVSSYEED